MGDKKEFKEALSGKKVPLLTLDQKWHQLFERNGKPIRVQRLEDKIKGLLTKQARANQKYQDLKKLTNTLMDNIVLNMKGTEENQGDTVSAKRLEEDRRLIDEINGKLAACEKELDEIPDVGDDGLLLPRDEKQCGADQIFVRLACKNKAGDQKECRDQAEPGDHEPAALCVYA